MRRTMPLAMLVLASLSNGVYCNAASTTTANASTDDAVQHLPPSHVPSPDWRDQIIYLAMIDRFADGNRANNDQGQGEYDPADGARWSGGDLVGVDQRLDYIRGLGATALWITPPVANRWWDASERYGGYHGYWASDFGKVDAHFGTLDDYRRLSTNLHARGMYLVQDVVLNHTGNYFRYSGDWRADDPTAGYTPNPDAQGRTAPTQWPFSQNDPRDPKQRELGIYHWTPAIRDGSIPEQLLTFQLAELDDINTESPIVRKAFRDTYGYWIREVGVDAFRVDTAYYVPPEFFADFLDGDDAKSPGISRVAEATGRRAFHVFGEGFGMDAPFADTQARRMETYTRLPDGRRALPAMINFPLYGTLTDVFARGAPTAALAHRIGNMMQVHRDPWRMPTFVDNHDVDRFLKGGRREGLAQALLSIMTLPGIPTIYYGTEQGFTEMRTAMFAGGHGAEGRDHFDTQAPLYRLIAELSALRKGHRVFSRGTPTVIADNGAGPGVIAWRMDHEGDAALVVINSADHEVLLANADTGLRAGRKLRAAFGLDGERAEDLRVDANGQLTLRLPAHGGWVWIAGDVGAAEAMAASSLEVDDVPANSPSGTLPVSGSAPPGEAVRVVLDGDLSRAIPVKADAKGKWRAKLDTASLIDPRVEHQVTAWSDTRGVAAPTRRFRVSPEWQLARDVEDPADDDHGPRGNYRYPDANAGFRHQQDLRGARVWTAGGALKIELQMAEISRQWAPTLGFDHVAFTVFVQLRGARGGATVMPQQDGQVPRGMRWHYRLRAHGWSNAMFSAEGATATREGTAILPSATIATDLDAKTVTFTVPAAALGRQRSLAGAKLYINTWDYGEGYRPLGDPGSGLNFSGGKPGDPRVMDDLTIELP